MTIKSKVETAIAVLSLKTVLESCINNISCGIIMGKPRIAIIAAFCWAFAAIADRKVKTRLRLQPPSNTNPINFSVKVAPN